MATLRTVWSADLQANYAPLAASRSVADVVVIGGGLMGTAVASLLARDGCDVVLVESAHLAAGSTGRNAGLMLHGVSEMEDPRLLRDVQCLEGIRDDYDVTGHLSLASSQSVWDAFKAEVARRPAWAPPLFALERGACEDVLRTRIDDRYPGGRWYPGGAVVHPVRYVGDLARAATRHGARIHEGTAVTNVGRDAGHAVVHTTRGLVAAGAVVHATAASVRLLPEFATIVRPARAGSRHYAAASTVLGGHRCELGRRVRSATSDGRFVIGGGGGASIAAHLDGADYIRRGRAVATQRVSAADISEFPPVSVQQSWAGVLDYARRQAARRSASCAAGQWICCGSMGRLAQLHRCRTNGDTRAARQRADAVAAGMGPVAILQRVRVGTTNTRCESCCCVNDVARPTTMRYRTPFAQRIT